MSLLECFQSDIANGFIRATYSDGAVKWLSATRIASFHVDGVDVIATTDNDKEHVVARCESSEAAGHELIETLKLLDPMAEMTTDSKES